MTTFSSSSSSFPFTLSESKSSNSSLPSFTSSFPVSMSSFISATSLPPSSFSSNFSTISPNQTQQNCTFDDPPLRVPLVVLYSVFFVFGLAGNIFALWVFLFLHTSRNSVRVFLINCAVADLVLLACLPFRVFYHLNGNNWGLGSVACKLVGNLFYMNMYISITLLGLISLDRYLRIKGKVRIRRGLRMRLWGCNRPWSWVACAVLWGLSLLAVIPMIAMAEDTEKGNKCFQFKSRQTAKGKAYFNMALVFLFWLVFFMLMVSYGKIAFQLLRVSRDKPDLPNAQRYQRTAKKSFFVLFLFTICFGPYHAFRPIYILSQLSQTLPCDYLQMVDRTNEVMLLFSAFNSCLDPVMYFLLSGSVRKTALSALGHRLGTRLVFLNEATSNSSVTEFRQNRTNTPMAENTPEFNTPSGTPRTSICVISSTLRRTGVIQSNGRK